MLKRQIKLLLVDNDQSVIDCITDLLSETTLLRYDIECVRDRKAALDAIPYKEHDVYLFGGFPGEHHCLDLVQKVREKKNGASVLFMDSSEKLNSALDVADGFIPINRVQQPPYDRFSECPVESILMLAMLKTKNKKIEDQTNHINELDTALRVVLSKTGQDTRELEETITLNLQQLIFPCLEQLKSMHLQAGQRKYVDLVENKIRGLFSPFLKNIRKMPCELSHMEIKVADLIREGKSSKDIANILGVSEKTVLTHRYHLRTKLGLKNKHVNLQPYLMSMEER